MGKLSSRQCCQTIDVSIEITLFLIFILILIHGDLKQIILWLNSFNALQNGFKIFNRTEELTLVALKTNKLK